MRLLIAEDEKDLNQVITKTLQKNHYSVDSCLDGQEALDCLDMAEYDAIILDIMMPRVSGLEVLKKLRSAGNKTPVLLLTARDSVQDRVAGLDTGADDYLVKPFAFEDELKEKTERLNALNIELNLNEKDTSVMDTEPEQTEEQPERKCASRER